MDEKRLAEISKRANEATDGPWIIEDGIIRETFISAEIVDCSCGVNNEVNAQFIANARQDIPDLVAEVERLRSVIWRISSYADLRIEETRKFLDSEDN